MRSLRRTMVFGAVSLFGVVALTAAATFGAPPPAPIDDFHNGIATAYGAAGTVLSAVGTNTLTDTGVLGVLGGSRQMKIDADAIAFPGTDNVTAGASFLGEFFKYSSTVQADGKIELFYDANGLGLNKEFGPDDKLEIQVLAADPASVPYTVTLTLADAINQASAIRVINVSGALNIDFNLSEFAAIDRAHVFSIRLAVDPQAAADLQFIVFRTFTPETGQNCGDGVDNDGNGVADCQDPQCAGTIFCRHDTPMLSGQMILAAIASLTLVGLIGVARFRRAALRRLMARSR